jgi:hypothetical protein
MIMMMIETKLYLYDDEEKEDGYAFQLRKFQLNDYDEE